MQHEAPLNYINNRKHWRVLPQYPVTLIQWFITSCNGDKAWFVQYNYEVITYLANSDHRNC